MTPEKIFIHKHNLNGDLLVSLGEILGIKNIEYIRKDIHKKAIAEEFINNEFTVSIPSKRKRLAQAYLDLLAKQEELKGQIKERNKVIEVLLRGNEISKRNKEIYKAMIGVNNGN